jgi:hypothetical protein
MTDDVRPSEGDFTLCIGCGTVLVFGENLIARLPKDHELKDLPNHPELCREIARIRSAILWVSPRPRSSSAGRSRLVLSSTDTTPDRAGNGASLDFEQRNA